MKEKKPHPRYTQLIDKAKKNNSYNQSDDPDKNGGSFGFLGRGENYYSDAELKRLGLELLEWIKKDGNIWCKGYFAMLDYPISWDMVKALRKRSPEFDSYVEAAKTIQEYKLLSEPYDYRKKKDGAHARWILARHHKGEWEEKPLIISPEDNEKLDKATALIDYLQSRSDASIDLNKADNSISNADKSKLDMGIDNA